MNWWAALGLVCLLEGAMPFFLPRQWRDFMQRITALSDGQIRFVGLIGILFGLAILVLA